MILCIAYCNGKCANIKWVAILVFKDVIGSGWLGDFVPVLIFLVILELSLDIHLTLVWSYLSPVII